MKTEKSFDEWMSFIASARLDELKSAYLEVRAVNSAISIDIKDVTENWETMTPDRKRELSIKYEADFADKTHALGILDEQSECTYEPILAEIGEKMEALEKGSVEKIRKRNYNEKTQTLNLEQIDEDWDAEIPAGGVWLKNVEEVAQEIEAVKAEVRAIVLENQQGCTAVPAVIGECTNLEELDLTYTPVKEVPDFVLRLPKLRTLKYGGYHLEKQPEAIGEAQNLEVLSLHVEKGQHIPAGVFSLAKLASLTIHGADEWDGLPEEIGVLKNLEELHIIGTFRKNAEVVLPASFSALKKLKKLVMGSYFWENRALDMDALAETLAPCPVEELELRNFDVGARYTKLPLLSGLKRLDFQYIHLDEHFLETACRLPALEKLSFYGKSCNIARVPPEIGNLQNLKEFAVTGCFFRDIPETLFSLPHLEIIDLSGCGILELSGSVGNLQNLKELRLDDNRLESLPDALFTLANLERLDIGRNNFSRRALADIQARLRAAGKTKMSFEARWQGHLRKVKLLRSTVFAPGQSRPAEESPFDAVFGGQKTAKSERAYLKLCEAAVDESPWAIGYVDTRINNYQYRLLCERAVKKNGLAVSDIPAEKLGGWLYFSIWRIAMVNTETPESLFGKIRHDFLTDGQYIELCLLAALHFRYIDFLKCIDTSRLSPDAYFRICWAAVLHNSLCIGGVDFGKLAGMEREAAELCALAAGMECRLDDIPEALRTREIVTACIAHAPYHLDIKAIPPGLLDAELARALVGNGHGNRLLELPEALRSRELCLEAVLNTSRYVLDDTLAGIPEAFKHDPEILAAAETVRGVGKSADDDFADDIPF